MRLLLACLLLPLVLAGCIKPPSTEGTAAADFAEACHAKIAAKTRFSEQKITAFCTCFFEKGQSNFDKRDLADAIRDGADERMKAKLQPAFDACSAQIGN